MDHKRGSFSGKIGFVLSAAGASVGLGNIWRFPYLAAKYGGAIFLLVYIILAMTFGYTMIIAETSIGRMTGKSPVGAYKSFSDKPALRVGGWINAIIPILIVPYYSVIGGWVIKYLAEYLMGKAHLVAEDGYFSSFISNGVSSELCFLVFTAMTLAIIFAGVENGNFVKAGWCGCRECEDKIKEKTAASSRVIAEGETAETCACCGKKAEKVVYFARAY